MKTVGDLRKELEYLPDEIPLVTRSATMSEIRYPVVNMRIRGGATVELVLEFDPRKGTL